MPDPNPFDHRAYCEDPDEYRLTDEALRGLVAAPGSWSRPLAREVLDLRARITELEQQPSHTPDRCTFPEGVRCMCNTSLQAMVKARVADIALVAAERDAARARIAELAAPPITVDHLAQWLLQTTPVTRENCRAAAERVLDLLREVNDRG